MAPRTLKEPYQTLLHEIIDTMLAGNNGKYPQSHSDMNYCAKALLKIFDVKRRPIAINLLYADNAAEQKREADDLSTCLCPADGMPNAFCPLHGAVASGHGLR